MREGLKKKRMELYVEPEQENILRTISKKNDISMSELFRQLISLYINDYIQKEEEKVEKITKYIQENTSNYSE